MSEAKRIHAFDPTGCGILQPVVTQSFMDPWNIKDGCSGKNILHMFNIIQMNWPKLDVFGWSFRISHLQVGWSDRFSSVRFRHGYNLSELLGGFPRFFQLCEMRSPSFLQKTPVELSWVLFFGTGIVLFPQGICMALFQECADEIWFHSSPTDENLFSDGWRKHIFFAEGILFTWWLTSYSTGNQSRANFSRRRWEAMKIWEDNCQA